MQLASCILLAGMVAVAGAVRAQDLHQLSLDVSVGGGSGFGAGEVHRAGGIALDAVIGLRLRASDRSAVMAGASVGFQGPLWSSDVCYVGTGGECLDDFPLLMPIALLAGWEAQSTRGHTIRAMAGPAYVRVDGDNNAGYTGRAVGAQARVDLATRPLGSVALIASARGTLLPRFRSSTLGAWSFGVGLRFS
jgi:hypothetical protein